MLQVAGLVGMFASAIITKQHIPILLTVGVFILALLTIYVGVVTGRAHDKARQRLKTIRAGLDSVFNNDEMGMFLFMKSVVPTTYDDKLDKLVKSIKVNPPVEKGIGYFDATGREFQLGDIVYNPLFCDYWIVVRLLGKEVETYDCEYGLAQYGNKEDMLIALDEPAGFRIVCSKNNKYYDDYLSEFSAIIKEMSEEME